MIRRSNNWFHYYWHNCTKKWIWVIPAYVSYHPIIVSEMKLIFNFFFFLSLPQYISDVRRISNVAKPTTGLHNGFPQYDRSNEFTTSDASNEYIQPVCIHNESTAVHANASTESFDGTTQSTNKSNQCYKHIIKSSYRTRLISFLHLI